MAFEVGKQYELIVKDVAVGRKNKFTLQVYEAKDRKHSFSIPMDADQLKMPVNSLKHQKVVADCVEIDGKARLRLAKEFYKGEALARRETASVETAEKSAATPGTVKIPAGNASSAAEVKEEQKKVVSTALDDIAAAAAQPIAESSKIVPEVVSAEATSKVSDAASANDGVESVTENPLSVFDTRFFKEDQTHEFKSSIFYAPGAYGEPSIPGPKQMREIARGLAAFMNADGGEMYIGINDKESLPEIDRLQGISEDFKVLTTMAGSVVAKSSRFSDGKYSYGGTPDKYELKIRAIVKAYLSENAQRLLGDIKCANVQFGDREKMCCRIEVKPCSPGEWVYSYDPDEAHPNTDVPNIYVRLGNGKQKLSSEKRDEYIKKRVKAEYTLQIEALSKAATGLSGHEELLTAIAGLKKTISGEEVTVNGAIPIEAPELSEMKSPGTLVWAGAHLCDVNSWTDLVLKILVKLQEINAAKFDELLSNKTFSRCLSIKEPNKHYTDFFKVRFGKKETVLVKKTLGSKQYLTRADSNLRKMIEAFGLESGTIQVTSK